MTEPRLPHYEPSGFFTLRTPLLPFEEYETWARDLAVPVALAAGADGEDLEAAVAADRERLRQYLRSLLERPEIREALFVASPDLYEGLEAWYDDPKDKKGRRAEEALVRYFLRMTTRPTPFGLFSGCSTGELGDTTRLRLEKGGAYRRETRLDMDYLFALTEELARDSDVRRDLRFRPNTSLYRAAGRLRYAEARVDGQRRSYHLVAVEPAEYLLRTLERAQDGANVAALAQGLVEDDPDGEILFEEAEEFVQELIDAQILVADLAPPVIGEGALQDVAAQCRELPAARHVAERLERAGQSLAELDAAGLGNAPALYRGLAEELEPLGAKVELQRLVQVDMVKPAAEARLGPRVIAELERGIDFLHRLSGPQPEDGLKTFREAFQKRYEDTTDVPLTEVLDEEAGIGFTSIAGPGADASPLIEGLAFPVRTENSSSWLPRHEMLLRRWQRALTAGETSIELGEKDLESLPEAELPPLPGAFQVMATLAAESTEAIDEGRFELHLKNAGGPSGARLLGRFCHTDDALRRRVEEHLRAEEGLEPDAIFAEIVHLPEGRIGNILARPRMRDYEIPFLGRGAAPRSHQIGVDDLRVSVLGGQVVLRSARLGRRVIPRLTSAHNFTNRSQGVYRFLCTLQSAGVRGGLGFQWGPLDALAFLPRVTHGRLVLSRARWRLDGEEIAKVAKKRRGERLRALAEWREEKRLPRRVMLVDGDNELLVDFDNVLAVDSFLALVKKRPQFVLEELFPDPESLAVRGPEGRFMQELVVPFVRRPPEPVSSEPTSSKPAPPERRPRWETLPEPTTSSARRVFAPGSEWLYAKLYTGTATADQLLRDAVGPLVREALGAGLAESWFFIRYGDPDWHLRVRFRGRPERLAGQLLPLLNARLAPFLEQGFLYRVEVDTYRRELERYGGADGIDLAEQLFAADSAAVLEIVELIEGDAGADARWRLALYGTDLLLEDLGFGEDERLGISRQMQESFANEFRVEAGFRQQLADRLRQERRALDELLDIRLDAENPSSDHPLGPGLAALARRSRLFAPLAEELRRRQAAGRLTAPLESLATSYVHMFNNRLLRSQGRAHEVVLYDFHHRLLLSRAARRRAMKKKKGKGKEA